MGNVTFIQTISWNILLYFVVCKSSYEGNYKIRCPVEMQTVSVSFGLTYGSQTDYIEDSYPMTDLSVCTHMSIYGMYVCMYVCCEHICVYMRRKDSILYFMKDIISIFEAFWSNLKIQTINTCKVTYKEGWATHCIASAEAMWCHMLNKEVSLYGYFRKIIDGCL